MMLTSCSAVLRPVHIDAHGETPAVNTLCDQRRTCKYGQVLGGRISYRERTPLMPVMSSLHTTHPAQSKLAGQWGVKYAAVAAHAAAQGRQRLAALLLDHEHCAAEQVPLLLELGKWGRGAAACGTRDTPLVQQCGSGGAAGSVQPTVGRSVACAADGLPAKVRAASVGFWLPRRACSAPCMPACSHPKCRP